MQSHNVNVDDAWDITPLPVLDKKLEWEDTVSIKIPTTGKNGKPGQFNMLYAFGIGEIPISISRISGEHVWHTIRNVGAVSAALTNLEPDDSICVRGPYGQGWLEIDSGHALFIAGGLGLAPLRPAIERALDAPSVQVTILYGTRSSDMILYPSDLARWREKAQVEITVDVADKNWGGHVGTVAALLDKIDFNPETTTALVCGPEIMMRLTASQLTRMTVSRKNIYLSMERNMKCATGHCGHCQWGPDFVCKDGPVYCYDKIADRFQFREL